MEALGCIRSVKLRMLTQGFFYDGIIHSAFPYSYQRRFVNEAGERESVSTPGCFSDSVVRKKLIYD